MEVTPPSGARSTGRATRISLTVILMLLGGAAHADDHPTVPVVSGRLFLTRGFSFRKGDWFSFEPSFLLVSGAAGPGRPIVGVARPMLGVGGSGAAIGVATSLARPCPEGEACQASDFLLSLPVSFEARVERMYGPTSWRRATYLGPQVTVSAYLFKAFAGWMVDVNDRTDRHVQLGIGFGF
jgi:hypothetical protein